MLPKNRFQSRLMGLCWTILEKRQPDFNADEAKECLGVVLVLKSLDFATEAEKQVIHQLSNIIKERSESTDERESILGALEGKSVVYDRLDPKLLLQDSDFLTTSNPSAGSSVSSAAESSAAESSAVESSAAEMSPKTKKILAIVASVVVLFLIFYNLPFMKEWRAYKNFLSDELTYEQFIDQYPDGRHAQEVTYLWIVGQDYGMHPMCVYLSKWPEGEYATELNEKYNQKWDAQIDKFNEYKSASKAPEAVAYMEEMLQYMKAHRVFAIQLNMQPQIELKDYEEFDESTRTVCEFLMSLGGVKKQEFHDMLIPLKSNFSLQDQGVLEYIISNGLQRSLDQIFDEGFISVVSEDEAQGLDATPLVSMVYHITNQYAEDTTWPEIWTYTENHIPTGYLLGIAITFESAFSIPGSSTRYVFNDQGEPEENISDIEGIKDGYRRMTQMSFMQFANKISSNLGLAEAY